jgi:hypothetical protein
MANGKRSHDWDLFAPLMCFVANPHLPSGKGLTVGKIHPFKNNFQNTTVLEYNKENWNALQVMVKSNKR